ncbi:MAG: site-specific integrase [Candidatus Thorarchaeota archaeon]|nr:MAG: site-specific integrase [Candidatus Thorarchaeota archaeon]
MARTTKKKLHPEYQTFLDEECSHVSESTLTTYTARLRPLPPPNKLTISWFKKRMKEISPHTASQERLVIKMFKKWNGDNTDEWKELKLPPKKESVTVKDLYTREELKSIFAACFETRDRAMFQVLYESAARRGELLNMKFEDIKFEDHGTAEVILTGKTGTRAIWIKDSVPALKAWMNVHPVRKGPLWIALDFPVRALTASGLTARVIEILKRANLGRKLKKKIHMFRHTRGTEVYILGLRGQSLNVFMGWSKGSNMEAVYVHLANAETKDEVRSKVLGIATTKKKYQHKLVSGNCPRCGVGVAENDIVCAKCSFDLTEDGRRKARAKKKREEYRIRAMEDMIRFLAGKMGLDTSDMFPDPPPEHTPIDEEMEAIKKQYSQKKKDYLPPRE